MQLGLCTSIDALADAAQAGFGFAELPVSALAIDQSAADFEAVRRRILAAPIRVAVEDNPQLLARSKLPQVDACRAVRQYLAPYCRGFIPRHAGPGLSFRPANGTIQPSVLAGAASVTTPVGWGGKRAYAGTLIPPWRRDRRVPLQHEESA